ncbi:MAG: glycosyltransferase [Prochloraceae cyanobacterium]|nr:glycosyltransferase [Prochloraceae cyanobacterium]
MKKPQITIVVVPRDRFYFARESLESLYKNTKFPFDLIYVDNNSPTKLRRYLEKQAKEKRFQLVQTDYYLSPNQARNLGLARVQSKYVVFVDNDVIFSLGWLEAIYNCAEETQATVVGPLVCQHTPLHEIIHCAGGEYLPTEEYDRFVSDRGAVPLNGSENKGKWHIKEKIYRQTERLSEIGDRLQRQPTCFIEFHCVLVRTDFFKRFGFLDEGLSCTKEYLDLAMTVTKAGGTIYLEPRSIVTFLSHPPAPPLQLSDIPYFMIRWSNVWELASLKHFAKKWDLVENEYFKRRYLRLGWRRKIEIIQPLSRKLSFGLDNPFLTNLLIKIDRQINRYLTDRHARILANRDRKQIKTFLARFPLLEN